jgi:SAM-dependent methyltransferase
MLRIVYSLKAGTKKVMKQESEIQRHYYAETADKYNDMHLQGGDEHYFALALLAASIDHFKFQSILDVGAGTGRALLFLKNKRPELTVRGIEPVAELREVGYRSGLSQEELTEGDATSMQFEDGQFDVVCEFGVLHHIRRPEIAVSEMLRVARVAIFISDSNNFGQGSFALRTIKQLINGAGLWKAFDLIKTRGRGYTISEGDGLAYSYSVFNNYKQIKRYCKSIHILNTQDGNVNPYRSAGHVALLGLKS